MNQWRQGATLEAVLDYLQPDFIFFLVMSSV